MAKKVVSKGQLRGMPGLCCGPGYEEDPSYDRWEEIFDEFYADKSGEAATLEEAIDTDLSKWNLPENFILWCLCRSSIIDSFVLRLFSSDCIEYTGSVLAPGEEVLVGEAVSCARSYAAGECDHDMLMSTRDTMMSRVEASPGTPEHTAHFFGVIVHALSAHPDAGAVQCAMSLPRCYEQLGKDSTALQTWMKAAFRKRCQEQGWFDEA